MSRTFSEAVRLLNGLQANHATLEALKRAGARLNLRSLPEMHSYLRRMGHDARDLDALNVIHVTGTKGKGSTCAFSESILRSAGLRTGLYTSPHLVSVRERIQLCGRPISTESFTRYFFETWDSIQPPPGPEQDGLSPDDAPPLPSYFRFLTLMCFNVFLREKVDVAILEVGIGGSYDATNIVPTPVVCGITSIGIDHTDVLGTTIESIAQHKAGIMKPGVPCLTTPQVPAAATILEQYSRDIGVSSLKVISADNRSDLRLSIAGEHQFQNATLANALSSTWLAAKGKPQLSQEQISQALANTKWPGRCQTLHIPSRSQHFFIDGAHTVESMAASVRWFASTRVNRAEPVTIIFNCTHDRDPAVLLAPVIENAAAWNVSHIIFCPNVAAPKQTASSDTLDRSLPPTLAPQMAMQRIWNEKCAQIESTVTGSVQEALALTKSPDVYVAGSLLLCGAVLAELVEQNHVDIFA